MSRILAIDPGNQQSGWVIIDTDTYALAVYAADTKTGAVR